MNLEQVKALAGRFAGLHVGVIGDLILDHYIWGEASRISPEAPVPVVHVKRRNFALGGAANVISNICGLGAGCRAYGVTGEDSHGDVMRDQLGSLGVDVSGVLSDVSRCTTVKTRVIAARQQVVRIDEEDTHELSPAVRKELMDRVKSDITQGRIQALIVEDYAKGLLDAAMVQELVDFAREAGVLTAMDPHPGHPMNIKSLTFITPNRMEAFALAGVYQSEPVQPVEADGPLMKVGAVLGEFWNPDCLLITLGPDGMAVFPREDEEFSHIPTKAKAVFDVSGAGDTVISTMMLGLLGQATFREAAELANHAAGVVVAQVGTVPISLDELLASYQ